ncbi:MAG: DUF1778 domain-containing protein [Gammaproteobacteria bacterium]|nr:DUF1778 domain-containing protein [Gammaproteobacteria bacterium]
MTTAKTERITARVNESIKDTLEMAASIMGATLNQFLVQAALEKAENIIEKDKLITLGKKDSKIFFEALSEPPEPNARLKSAMNNYNSKIG